jgi:hypothetical protein
MRLEGRNSPLFGSLSRAEILGNAPTTHNESSVLQREASGGNLSLKLCVIQVVQACILGVPILAEELERAQ